MSKSAGAQFEIVIVGGGLVGVSLALLLSQMLRGRRIALIEAAPVNSADAGYTPSFDARSTALSLSSCQIYQALGIWPQLSEYSTAIQSIHVSERGRPGSTRLDAAEQQLSAFGHVVENRWLGSVLLAKLNASPSVVLLAPEQVAQVKAEAAGMRLRLESGGEICTSLLVVADGANSATRDMLGIAVEKVSYERLGLITNVVLGSSHRHMAYERFTDEGPLALLPLSDIDGKARAALIWTLSAERAAELTKCDEQRFLEALQQQFGYRQGIFRGLGERHVYPLQRVLAKEQVRSGLVVMGNAAHALHPVAGQGFNLALRDCATLASVLAQADVRGESWSSLKTLGTYLNARTLDQARTVLLSDKLPKMFGLKGLPAVAARNLTLLALNLAPSLRSEVANLGMGLMEAIPPICSTEAQQA